MPDLPELSEIRRDIAALRETAARTDANVAWICDALGNQVSRTDKHEERLGKVESRQWWLSGLWAGIGAILGFGGANGLKP